MIIARGFTVKTYVLDYNGAANPLPHHWELCVGSCHAATALREGYREQLRKCHRGLGFIPKNHCQGPCLFPAG